MTDEFAARRRGIPHPSSFIPRIALAAVLLFAASTLLALDVPPAPSQWFTDKAGLLDATQADTLNRKLQDFEQTSGAQFLIYVFPSLENESMEDFTMRAAEKWKVGQKKYDNGLILFVFVKERKLRIEVGYGLEGSVTDAYSSRVIRDYIAPHFQQGDWAGGLNAGADALIAKIRGGEAPVPPLQPSGSASGGSGSGGSIVIPILIILIFLFFILPMLRRGGGGCGGCFWPMFFMGGGGGTTFGGGGGGFGGFGGGGGGFSGGGGSFGGGGASGGW